MFNETLKRKKNDGLSWSICIISFIQYYIPVILVISDIDEVTLVDEVAFVDGVRANSINPFDATFSLRGASFGDTINLGNNTGDSTDSDIVSTNDGGTYVVWTDKL